MFSPGPPQYISYVHCTIQPINAKSAFKHQLANLLEQCSAWRHDKNNRFDLWEYTNNFFITLFSLPTYVFNLASWQLVFIVAVASELRQATYSNTGMCSTDAPYTVKKWNSLRCASECLKLATCEDFNYDSDMNECALFLHKPLFYDLIPGCSGFKASLLIYLLPPCYDFHCVCLLTWYLKKISMNIMMIFLGRVL